MPRDGTATRERILDAAESLVLEHGFAGTSIDQLLARAGITKGAFFYHFDSKARLARALLERYVARDERLLEELMGRAESLSRDPLQQYLIFVGLLEERLRGLQAPHPGCLVGSYMYQLEAFDPDTRQAVVGSFETWRRVLGDKLEAARARKEPTIPVSTAELVENLLSLFEGSIILSRMYARPAVLAEQTRQHRNYVELLFRPAG